MKNTAPVLAPALLAALMLAAPIRAAYAVTAAPRPTPWPDFTGCSSEQRDYLKQAWRRAHEYAWRADRMLQYIRKQGDSERRYLWDLDYRPEVQLSTSPRTFFGPYNGERFQNISDAVSKAVRRFENRGRALKGIKKIRCGQPVAPRPNEHIDVCPKAGTGGGSPTAYHAIAGYIVTCPSFWDIARDTALTSDQRLDSSAKTLVHEIFHWLSVDGKYIVDRHGGVDRKGAGNVALLAKSHRNWAIRNNDNYTYFIRNVGQAQPTLSAVWTGKRNPGSGIGAFYVDMSWDGLVARRNQMLGTKYLTSVTTYVKDGERRYAAVWRAGPGGGALYSDMDWTTLKTHYQNLKATQHLIDVDVYKVGNGFRYTGVWRHKHPGEQGQGGLGYFRSWDQLMAWRASFGDNAHLRDLETFVVDSQRHYIAVALPSNGGGALYWYKDREVLDAKRASLEGSQELVDLERFLDGDGVWNYIGLWRPGPGDSGVSHDRSLDFLDKRFGELAGTLDLLKLDHFGPLPTRIP